jgi:hypothetical protein
VLLGRCVKAQVLATTRAGSGPGRVLLDGAAPGCPGARDRRPAPAQCASALRSCPRRRPAP